jgi:hypothetical protein
MPKGRPPGIPEFPFKIPGVWAEDNPPDLTRDVPLVVVDLKPLGGKHQAGSLIEPPPLAKNSTSFPIRPRLEFKNTLTDS